MIYIIPTSISSNINNIFSSLGTYILVILLMIIITSLIYTQSRAINMLSVLIGVLGTLFMIIRGLKEGTLSEYMDFRVALEYSLL